MPDLEVPGIKAKHCDSPITNACLAEIELMLWEVVFILSANKRINPKKMVA